MLALVLGIPTVLLSLGGHVLPGEVSVPVLFAGHLCAVLFLFGASVLIVKSLFSAITARSRLAQNWSPAANMPARCRMC